MTVARVRIPSERSAPDCLCHPRRGAVQQAEGKHRWKPPWQLKVQQQCHLPHVFQTSGANRRVRGQDIEDQGVSSFQVPSAI